MTYCFSVPIISIIPWILFSQYQCLHRLVITDNIPINRLPSVIISSIVKYHWAKSRITLLTTKFYCRIVFTSCDIGQYVFCNFLLTRLLRHKFQNEPYLSNQVVFQNDQKLKTKMRMWEWECENENEQSFQGEINSIFHNFWRTFSYQKLSQTWECALRWSSLWQTSTAGSYYYCYKEFHLICCRALDVDPPLKNIDKLS